MPGQSQTPLYGRRLLLSILDEEARSMPDRVFAVIPEGPDTHGGFRDVLIATVAAAADYLAHQLQSTFGCTLEQEFETLTYIGVPDLRYCLIFYAAVKCGYKVLLPSPRNPLSTNLLLMEQTQSTKVVYSTELALLVDTMRTARPTIRYWSIPNLDDLLNANGPHVPYDYNFEEAKRHPILVLHSSGSTGTPKPVTMTNGSFAVIDNDRNFPTVPGRRNHDLTVWDFSAADARLYEPFPPFHLAGFFNKVTVPLYTHTIPVFGPPSRPPSGTLVAEILQQIKVRGLLLPPVIAEQLLQQPNGLKCFEDLDVFCYAGGPLSQAAGDRISQVTTVCQFYGSTEIGQVRQLVPVREDWSYIQFHPASKLEMQPAEDNSYELVINADHTTDGEWALNHNYPGVGQWRTKDLFLAHPTKAGLWQFYGRRDDILVLSNGEKFNPVPTETALQQHPSVAGALIVGQGRSQLALLIEPLPHLGRTSTEVVGDIWPWIETANLSSPSHGRIRRSLILVISVDKPLIRAGKGTVVRKLSEDAYRMEIDQLYNSAISSIPLSPINLPIPVYDEGTILNFVRSVFEQVLPNVDLKNDEDVYNCGLDSLKTLDAVCILKQSFKAHNPNAGVSWLSNDVFYGNPTIDALSRVLLSFLNEARFPDRTPRKARMKAMLEPLSDGLLSPEKAHPAKSDRSGLCIALTGVTGSLGLQLLRSLITQREVTHVYCLSRSAGAQDQWYDWHKQRLSDISYTARLTFLKVQYNAGHLGLPEKEFNCLKTDVNVIVHNAWMVDFNRSLEGFHESLSSIQTLINLSLSSPRRPQIIFISSTSSAGLWSPVLEECQSIKEEATTDFNAPLELGYAESKFVAERLLDVAATQHGLSASILRIGQIAGSTQKEDPPWSLKCIPSDLPDVDWIPVDTLATIVTEIILSQALLQKGSDGGAEYFNIVNLHPRAWKNFIPTLQDFCGPDTEVVSLAEWVDRLPSANTTNWDECESAGEFHNGQRKAN
ncbi:MAG: hypothetical protein Q9219_005872 [cf. Caloplaca sp. 3 TL-2023]